MLRCTTMEIVVCGCIVGIINIEHSTSYYVVHRRHNRDNRCTVSTIPCLAYVLQYVYRYIRYLMTKQRKPYVHVYLLHRLHTTFWQEHQQNQLILHSPFPLLSALRSQRNKERERKTGRDEGHKLEIQQFYPFLLSFFLHFSGTGVREWECF
jgi:hypothetical protein